MLEEILRLLVKGQTMSSAQLARHLGVTQGLIDQMLIDLERGGAIVRFSLGCDTGQCEHCASKAGCHIQPTLVGWSLTAKGRRMATSALKTAGS